MTTNEKGCFHICETENGIKYVRFSRIQISGKRRLDWKEAKRQAQALVGLSSVVIETRDVIHIGNDFPNEFTGSNYTYSLKGMQAKAKANLVFGLLHMITIARNKNYKENKDEKHQRNAKYGWYRFDTWFSLPVQDQDGKHIRDNLFHASLLVRHAEDGKMYLYDVLKIKKEMSTPLEPKAVYDTKPIS